jgi:ribosomal protein L7/L12
MHSRDDLEARVDRLEKLVSDMAYRLGMQTGFGSDSGLRSEVAVLLQQKSKLEAIKLYRERTGLGLKEAKDAVEAIEKGMGLS